MADSLAQLASPPVFVVGHHRSGTTWVQDILTYPDDVAGVFESWMFTFEYGVGALLHWAHWGDDVVKRAEDIVGMRAGLGQLVDREEVVRVCREITERWLARALQPQHRYLVEKSPDHLHVAGIIAQLYPEARFVHVIRDGRDVAVSLRSASAWEAEGSRKERSATSMARRWRRAMRAGERIRERLGPRLLEVTYEDLKARPSESVAELFRFCGIPASDDVIAAAIAANEFEKRYQGGEDRFRRAGRTGDWRRALSFRDRLRFHRAAGDALLARGYESSRWWWLRPKRR
jgi:hypothetical protein